MSNRDIPFEGLQESFFDWNKKPGHLCQTNIAGIILLQWQSISAEVTCGAAGEHVLHAAYFTMGLASEFGIALPEHSTSLTEALWELLENWQNRSTEYGYGTAPSEAGEDESDPEDAPEPQRETPDERDARIDRCLAAREHLPEDYDSDADESGAIFAAALAAVECEAAADPSDDVQEALDQAWEAEQAEAAESEADPVITEADALEQAKALAAEIKAAATTGVTPSE